MSASETDTATPAGLSARVRSVHVLRTRNPNVLSGWTSRSMRRSTCRRLVERRPVVDVVLLLRSRPKNMVRMHAQCARPVGVVAS